MTKYFVMVEDVNNTRSSYSCSEELTFSSQDELGVPLMVLIGVDGRRHYINMNNVISFSVQEVKA